METDIAVIGAGALGLSTALHCALRGRSVVVVDRAAAGSQASGRAAGLFKSVQADQARTLLARRSIERVAHFQEWAGVPLAVRQTGSFLVARTAKHQAFLRAELAQSRQWGVDLREADAAELDAVVEGSPPESEKSLVVIVLVEFDQETAFVLLRWR